MKYEVVGFVEENGQRREIIYAEFPTYAEAYDYKEWLEDSNNWKDNLNDKPYIVSIREIYDAWTEMDEDIRYENEL